MDVRQITDTVDQLIEQVKQLGPIRGQKKYNEANFILIQAKVRFKGDRLATAALAQKLQQLQTAKGQSRQDATSPSQKIFAAGMRELDQMQAMLQQISRDVNKNQELASDINLKLEAQIESLDRINETQRGIRAELKRAQIHISKLLRLVQRDKCLLVLLGLLVLANVGLFALLIY